jgi:uncharacterized iron-regulated membrane protein
MRSFLVFVVFVGLGGVYLWQKQPPAAATADAKPATVTKSSAAAPVSTAEPHREPSEHNWMKRSLDRATAVRDQARGQTRAAQEP